jgi:hypothetical protein
MASVPAPQVALDVFFTRFDAYCAATEQDEGPVSSALFGASDRVSEIRQTRSDVGAKRLAAADARLAELAAAAGVELPTAEPVTGEMGNVASVRRGGERR